MNILITGGAGFIGSSLALDLISNGHTVYVMDNLSPQIHGANSSASPTLLKIKDKVNFIQGDVNNREHWKLVLPGIDCVVHFAAETGTGQSMYQAHRYMDTNVGGTANLLDLLGKEGCDVKRIVIASSRAIYGE